MAQKYFDFNTLTFLLYDIHKLESVMETERYADYDKESVDMFLAAVKDFADKELFPYIKEMDSTPAHYKDGTIWTHPQLATIFKKAGEMGLISGLLDYDQGGMQLPFTVYTASCFLMEAANNHAIGYLGLTFGAAELIYNFGNESQVVDFASRMITGEWGGTMCLTEPQAGSSLSDISTTATLDETGNYKIKGHKIFISGGDHEHCDNIIHLVLARIDGAPKGTKGISLFIVPKKLEDTSGELISNDVTTAGDFQKLGQKGYCTAHLVFGDNEDCTGYLVGQANHGLRYMFLMMNSARIAVGRGAASIATAAYYASLEYATERAQGRRINNMGQKDISKEQVLIIHHPDVRRLLLLQKAITEGGLSLILKASTYYDLYHNAKNDSEKEKYNLLLELLMPVTKSYPAEAGIHSCNAAVQVLGGYGFTSEYIPQMYLRDIRIASIYEGTTGIQSLDLLSRKIPMANGKALHFLFEEVAKTIDAAGLNEDLQPFALKLDSKIKTCKAVIDHLGQFATKGAFERYISDSAIFLDLFSNLIIAWQWLDIACVSKTALLNEDKTYSSEFYESKIHTMRFFYKYELPKIDSAATILLDMDELTISREQNVFL